MSFELADANSFECKLYKLKSEMEDSAVIKTCWIEYKFPVVVSVSNAYGFTFREKSSGSMVCDLPKACIVKLKQTYLNKFDLICSEKYANLVVVIIPGTESESLKFANSVREQAFDIEGYHSNSDVNRCQDDLSMYPDLSSVDNQRLLLQLLFSNEFNEFVSNVDTLLTHFSSVVN